MDQRSERLRSFFARLVCAAAGSKDPRLEKAFERVERERFAGPGPWSVTLGGHDYIETPDSDVAFIYQNTLIALDPVRGVNIGQPSWHALWLDSIALKEGEIAVQIGAGTGYYTAVIAHLVGRGGYVHAYEIDPGFAIKAHHNLERLSHVSVHHRSGVEDGLPEADAIYVCAGVPHPSRSWLTSLRPNGRLLFPLQPEGELGGMLLVRRPVRGSAWPANFISRAQFISCEGLQNEQASRRLTAAFANGWDRVRSFRMDEPRDDTCWTGGDWWWLSTAEPESEEALVC